MSRPNAFCPKCGDRLAVAARFCEGCGHPVGGPADAERASAWACPSCGAQAEPAYRAVERLQRSDLVEPLVEPAPPRPFALGTWLLLLLIPVLNILSIFLSPVRGGLKAWVGVSAMVFIGFMIWSVTGTFEDPFAARDVTMAVGLTVFLLYFAALVVTWFRERAAVRRELLPGYMAALERRRHLGFCEPCGIVFFDDRPGASAPVSRTSAFVGTGGVQRKAEPGSTPAWMWMVMVLITFGGAALVASMMPESGRAEADIEEAVLEEPWADLQADEVRPDRPVDESGGLGSLDAPLIADTAR